MNDSLRELDSSRQFYLVAALHTKQKELGNARLLGGPRRDCSEWRSARMVSLSEVLPSSPWRKLKRSQRIRRNKRGPTTQFSAFPPRVTVTLLPTRYSSFQQLKVQSKEGTPSPWDVPVSRLLAAHPTKIRQRDKTKGGEL